MWDDLELVTLAMAKDQLRVTTPEEDDDIDAKLRQAHDLVLDYIDRSGDWHDEILAWTSETVPKAVQAAICRMLANLRRFRGDDEKPSSDGLDLPADVRVCLRMYRDPVMA